MTVSLTPSDRQTLANELTSIVSGEVRFDKMSRIIYSTDASIYQMEPIGVVLPRDSADVAAVIQTAGRYGVAVLPRGGGTSLGGQTVGNAVVIDFSKYMRKVLEVNTEEGWVRAEPGIILDELNRQLKASGRMFTPDPSTSNRGNLGGAIGNNSCGAHSIVWGKTIDNVQELEVVLSNGATAHFGVLSEEEYKVRKRSGGLEGEIYRQLAEIGHVNREEVLARYPKILRRVSGYNLDELTQDSPLNMARFVVGSEGTLVTAIEAKVATKPIPQMRVLAILHFSHLLESMEATVATLELGPSAIEHIGSMILANVRSSPAYARLMDFVEGEPESILAVEFIGDSELELTAKLDSLEDRMRQGRLGYAIVRLTDPKQQEKVWSIRKAGLGLMMNSPGDAKPLPFVEDTAVSPEILPEYIRRFDEIVRDHNTSAGYYGHASVGCLHIRPLINLKLQDGVDRMISIASAVSDLVLEFGGSMSGEHGDGLARSMWNEKMFGPKIYGAFREIKQVFDPTGIMNPGKIIDSPPMTENLRISPDYNPIELKTELSFTRELGFARAIEQCNGQGACRKVTEGTMCPSYIATRDEEHSTRGRANALRAAISGALPLEALTDQRLFDVMDLCLECKACKSECPSNVDMAKLKYEFLYNYHKANGYPLKNRLFGNVAALSRLGSAFAPVSNWTLRSGAVKDILEKVAGIDSRRTLPNYSGQTFQQWLRARGGSPAKAATRGRVVLFLDTFTNFNHPEVGRATIVVLEKLGYQVIVPKVRCCGRPMLSAGMLDKARTHAREVVSALVPYVRQGLKVIGLEPSCILALVDDYRSLLDDQPDAVYVSDGVRTLEQFILEAIDNGAKITFQNPPEEVAYHGHCHQKALTGTTETMEVLNSVLDTSAHEIEAGCCGMAGAFGFEKTHYDVSMQMGEHKLFPAVRKIGTTPIISNGVSCRQQIRDGTGRQAIHLAEMLVNSL